MEEDSYDNEDDTYDEEIHHCEQLIAQGNIGGAVAHMKGLADESALYKEKYEEYARKYVADTLATAKRFADENNYSSAISILKDACKIYNCSEFVEAIEKYNEKAPKKLSFCKRVDEEGYMNMGVAKDCFGNEYEQAFGFEGATECYAVFYLAGKYETLSGHFVVNEDFPYSYDAVSCKIYADEKMIYESPEMGRTSFPLEVNLDIADIELLRVEIKSSVSMYKKSSGIFDLTVS